MQWPSLAEVELVLAALIERGYAQRLDRRPGQKEERFAQLLGGAPTDPRPKPLPEAPSLPRCPAPQRHQRVPAGVVGPRPAIR